MKEGKNKNMLG